MVNGKNYNRPRTVKLDKEEDAHLQHHCKQLGVDVSAFIRKAINEKLNHGNSSHIAGNNVLEYNKKTDGFAWKVKLDRGEEKTILEDVSNEFLEDLLKELIKARHERAFLTQRDGNKPDSVTVPRRLVENG
ncbi:MAG: CopG family transcriptional regulator [Nanoarchaeota archaeon]|nr:CopG family transcriptional regulator [Nanoarchaeota archaeon]